MIVGFFYIKKMNILDFNKIKETLKTKKTSLLLIDVDEETKKIDYTKQTKDTIQEIASVCNLSKKVAEEFLELFVNEYRRKNYE